MSLSIVATPLSKKLEHENGDGWTPLSVQVPGIPWRVLHDLCLAALLWSSGNQSGERTGVHRIFYPSSFGSQVYSSSHHGRSEFGELICSVKGEEKNLLATVGDATTEVHRHPVS